NACIDHAIALAKEQGVKGKEITPFLLDKIKTLTEGKSLAANIQLVLNNARLGAAIAVALCKLS
ncbi:MAG: pseudouridine-5'-phosphate glycosidase, partial [Clostridia bacterium]